MNLVPFGSTCILQNGRAFKPSEWSSEGVPIVRIQNLNDELKPFNYCNFEVDKKFHVERGDLLFSWSGTPGTSFGAFFWMRGKGYLNQHIFRVDVDESKIDKRYLRYAINSKLGQIIDQAHGGVGLKHITKGKLEAVEIPLPGLDEQQRVAVILGKAENLGRKRQQAIQLADEFLRAVFLDMFGDPLSNPKNWDVKILKKLTSKIGSGATPKGGKEAYQEEGISLIRSLNIHDNKFLHKDLAFISEEQSGRLSNVVVERGDVLLNITGASVCRCAIVDDSVLPARVNQHVCILRPESIPPNYLLHLLISAPYKRHLLSIAGAGGATREALTKTQVEDLPIPVPPQDILDKFDSICSRLKSLSVKKSAFAEEPILESLSQKAFSGEL
ncbi:MAG: restriction endonuclease subunit S [Pseudomonadota bacterium]